MNQVDDQLLIAFLLNRCDLTRVEAEEMILLMTIQGEENE